MHGEIAVMPDLIRRPESATQRFDALDPDFRQDDGGSIYFPFLASAAASTRSTLPDQIFWTSASL